MAAAVAAAAMLFARPASGGNPERAPFAWLLRRPAAIVLALAAAALGNQLAAPGGLHPLFVKGQVERLDQRIFEEWNSFSRIMVYNTGNRAPHMWGPSPVYDAADWPIRSAA